MIFAFMRVLKSELVAFWGMGFRLQLYTSRESLLCLGAVLGAETQH